MRRRSSPPNIQFGLGWDFWLVMLFGILIGAALAAVFGLLAIRASGVYFLMITLALGQCVWGLAYRWNSLTGGDNGINLRRAAEVRRHRSRQRGDVLLPGVRLSSASSLLLMYTLVRSPFGRSLAGIRERELRMKILGYNTWLHKYIAFIIAGAFGGLSGVLWAHTAGIVSPVNVESDHVGRRAADGRARRLGHAGRRRRSAPSSCSACANFSAPWCRGGSTCWAWSTC